MRAEDEKNHYSKEKLLQYLNLDLFIDDMIEIEHHLSDCATCRILLVKLEPSSNKYAGNAVFENPENKEHHADLSKNGTRLMMGLTVIFVAGVYFCLLYHFAGDDFAESLLENETATNSLIMDSIRNDKDVRMNAESVSIVHAELKKRQPKSASAQKPFITKHLPDYEKKKSEFEKDHAEASLELAQESEKVVPASRDISNQNLETQPKMHNSKNLAEKNYNHSTESNKDSVENKAVKSVQLIHWHIDVSLDDNESPQPTTGIDGIRELVRKKIEYPTDSLASKMKSNSVIEFRVKDDGSLDKFKVLESIGYHYDEKLIEILKKGPKWRPFVSPEFIKYDAVKITFTLGAY